MYEDNDKHIEKEIYRNKYSYGTDLLKAKVL